MALEVRVGEGLGFRDFGFRVLRFEALVKLRAWGPRLEKKVKVYFS